MVFDLLEFQISVRLEKEMNSANITQMKQANQELTLKLSKHKQMMDSIIEVQQRFKNRISQLEGIYTKDQNDNLQAINHINAEFDKSIMRVKDHYYAKLKLITLDSSKKQEEMLK